MIKYILALLFLLPAQVWGGVFIGFGQSGGGSTPTAYDIQTSHDSARLLDSTNGKGQTFTVASGQGGQISKFKFGVSSVNTPGTITCRIGNSAGQTDMSSNYTEGSVSISTSDTTYEVSFTGGPTLAVGSTYGVACQTTNAWTYVWFQNSNAYAGGGFNYNAVTGWNLNAIDGTSDMYFGYTVLQ